MRDAAAGVDFATVQDARLAFEVVIGRVGETDRLARGRSGFNQAQLLHLGGAFTMQRLAVGSGGAVVIQHSGEARFRTDEAGLRHVQAGDGHRGLHGRARCVGAVDGPSVSLELQLARPGSAGFEGEGNRRRIRNVGRFQHNIVVNVLLAVRIADGHYPAHDPQFFNR